jgi:glycerol kinase
LPSVFTGLNAPYRVSQMRKVVTGIPVVLDTAPIRKRGVVVVAVDVKIAPLSSY